MDTGRLRTRITFLEAPTTRNAFNEVTNLPDMSLWTPVFEAWATVAQLRGVLLDIAQARTATAAATHQITMRWNPNVAITQRIIYTPPIEPGSIDGIGELGLNDYSTLSLEQLDGLGLDTVTIGASPITRYFTITSIVDENSRHRMMTLMCCEVTR